MEIKKQVKKRMVVLIAGASHTGKTLLSQKLLEKYKFPYISIDHIKTGLIRSGNTALTPEDDKELTAFLWPIIQEIVKTAVENRQNLVIEGGYIPFDWKKDFNDEYLKEIRYYCLVMTEDYIKKHFFNIKKYANLIETRKDDSCCTLESTIRENAENLMMCKKFNCNYILIDHEYKVDINL